jgi:hypothetical protein
MTDYALNQRRLLIGPSTAFCWAAECVRQNPLEAIARKLDQG